MGGERLRRKLVNYVARDALSKVKSYARKRRLNLSDYRSPAGANVLHLAAEFGSELCVRYFVKVHASLLEEADSLGDLPLHKGVGYLLTTLDCSRTSAVYTDIVQPLLTAYEPALYSPNHKGLTPHELLADYNNSILGSRQRKSCGDSEDDTNEGNNQPDDAFRQKLFENIDEDERQSYYNGYGDDEQRFERSETYDEWAERLASERRQKLHKQRPSSSSRPKRKAPNDDKSDGHDNSKEKARILQAEAAERDADCKRARRSALQLKRVRHQQALQQILDRLGRNTEAGALSAVTFPWPTVREAGRAATADEMVKVLLSDIDMTDTTAVRARAKELQKTWHPDKIEQKFGASILESSRTAILEKVKEIAQILNSHLQSK